MTLEEKIKNNIKLTEEENKKLIAMVTKQEEEYREAHKNDPIAPEPVIEEPKPEPIPEPVFEKTEEQKIIDGDIPTPPEVNVIDGKIVPKTPEELYKDKVWTKKQYAQYKRSIRDSYLWQTDKYMISDFPISAKNKEIITTYRQTLRDLPKQKGFPDVEVPEIPKEIR